jgi:nucleotide-binding universal stress UspA family protein
LAHGASDGCDLIVLAKHGVRERDPGLMGTTAERVAHEAVVPVLVVYEDAATPAPSALPAYPRVAVCTDHSEDSRLGIVAALAVTEPFGSALTVLNAIAVPTATQSGAGATRAAATDKAFQGYLEAQHAHLAAGIAALQAPRLSAHIAAGMLVPETVTAAAAALGMALLCIPTHGKGALRRALFGSVTDRVMRLAPLPVLIMPRPWLLAEGS